MALSIVMAVLFICFAALQTVSAAESTPMPFLPPERFELPKRNDEPQDPNSKRKRLRSDNYTAQRNYHRLMTR